MKKNKKVLRFMLSLIVMITLILSVCYSKEKDSNVPKNNPSDTVSIDDKNCDIVDTISIDSKNCDIIVQKSENNNFKYDYSKDLFEVTAHIEENELKITARGKDAIKSPVDHYWIFISIPNSLTNKKIDIQNYDASINLCEINAEINMVNNDGTVWFYIPKKLNHNITYTGVDDYCMMTFCDEADNFTFNLSQEDCNARIPFSDYISKSSNYTHVEGDGSAQINIDLTDSSFRAEISDEKYE